MFKSQIDQDYEYCQQIIKEASKSFYFAFSQLPQEKAKGVYAIYAWNRIVDDSVDEEENDQVKKEKLDQHRQDIQQMRQIDSPIYRALTDTFDRFGGNIDPYLEQLDGQEMDIHFSQPKSLDDLEKYSDYVAGSVGRMLLPLLASKHDQIEDLYPLASDLGIAMQLTNILRDLGEDYRERQRIYIPADLMESHGYSVQDLGRSTINSNFVSLWESLARRAEDLYDRFFVGLDVFDTDSQKQLRKSAKVYHEILEVIRENGYNCLTERQYVPKRRMLLL